MKDLWRESRGNIIGTLVGAVAIAVFTWLLNTLFSTTGLPRPVLAIMLIVWLAFLGWLGYVGYLLVRRYQGGQRQLTSRPAADREDMIMAQNSPYYSCFISHSTNDLEFAEKLHADLIDAGVQCWFSPEDMKTGDKIGVTLDQSVWDQNKLLLIFSEHSIASDWVEREVEMAMAKERVLKQQGQGVLVLFPIMLDKAVLNEKIGWAAYIKNTRRIGDFTRWTTDEEYQRAFRRLLRDLRVES